jgi:hypothetical protein
MYVVLRGSWQLAALLLHFDMLQQAHHLLHSAPNVVGTIMSLCYFAQGTETAAEPMCQLQRHARRGSFAARAAARHSMQPSRPAHGHSSSSGSCRQHRRPAAGLRVQGLRFRSPRCAGISAVASSRRISAAGLCRRGLSGGGAAYLGHCGSGQRRHQAGAAGHQRAAALLDG